MIICGTMLASRLNRSRGLRDASLTERISSQFEQRRFNRHAGNGRGSAQRWSLSSAMRCGARGPRAVEWPHAPFPYQSCSRRSSNGGGFSLRSSPRHHHVPRTLGRTCSTIPVHRSRDRRPSTQRPKRRRSNSLPRSSDITAAVGARRLKTPIRSTSARTATYNRWPARQASMLKRGAPTASSTRCGECRRKDRLTTSDTSRS